MDNEQTPNTPPNNRRPGSGDGKGGFNFGNNRFALFVLLAVLSVFVLMLLTNNQTTGQEIPYSQFLSELREGRVES